MVSTGVGLLGHNMVGYCENNPVNRFDSTGKAWTYNGISYVYNGSIADFRRAEQGLPPLAYQQAINANVVFMSKKATNRPDSGLRGVPDEEI